MYDHIVCIVYFAINCHTLTKKWLVCCIWSYNLLLLQLSEVDKYIYITQETRLFHLLFPSSVRTYVFLLT